MVCLGTVAALGGGDGPDGYVAVGAAGGAPGGPGESVAPSGKVRLVPLDPAGPGSSRPSHEAPGSPAGSTSADSQGSAPAGSGTAGTGAAGGGSSPRTAERDGSRDSSDSSSGSGSGSDTGTGSGGASGPGGHNGPTTPGSSAPGNGGQSSPSAPAAPAALEVSEPVLKDADKRWCQDVTLVLRNSGGSAVRSGTVTFKTHIIGSLGIDWATVESTEKLPVPLGAGEEKKKTWTVCVESWRVPLGMHVETRDVSVDWK